uniref:Uncharacterized protein n=1 Tax=Mycena chlorophos TaxID=658473 RepID=A0ABQ0L637_MYCCL|nr:predicted protein [Mycena chlorophos]
MRLPTRHSARFSRRRGAEWCYLFRQAELSTTRCDTVSSRDDTNANGKRRNTPRIRSSTPSRPTPMRQTRIYKLRTSGAAVKTATANEGKRTSDSVLDADECSARDSAKLVSFSRRAKCAETDLVVGVLVLEYQNSVVESKAHTSAKQQEPDRGDVETKNARLKFEVSYDESSQHELTVLQWSIWRTCGVRAGPCRRVWESG